ncbi:methanogenesis marker 2 protein [Methanosarcina sp. KYL-1]|uniref:methanogenesis marker 2 protein n=1 Tax=Methanosarcina sp. KYL-1 TaxID=2602068 RepID=UPI002100D544|nr:methanogenesis marker 2 protein [Methanosarcina sp. KYL-1]MCQ1534388.1 methanogenesis marker 2 protein [Methanosarcina sp. KYL-1]
MDLEELAERIRNFEGVTRKKPIEDIVSIFETVRPEYKDAIVDFGDDAAVIDIGGEDVILFAADGIWGRLLDASPWWAGYGAVVVNVNDIAAMGGRPLAMVDIASANSPGACRELMEGLAEGVRKFGVPVVGGHLHPDTNYNSLSVAIIGIAKKDCVIRSDTASPGDLVIAAYDMDGKIGPNSPYSWDTTSYKEPSVVRERYLVTQEIAKRKLATAGKDISNPGLVGTLGMLCETSKVGASVDLEKVPRPEGVDFEQWLKVHPGTGYVFTASAENAEECVKVFEKAGLTASVIGKIEEGSKLDIYDKTGRTTVFDFSKDSITGIGSE